MPTHEKPKALLKWKVYAQKKPKVSSSRFQGIDSVYGDEPMSGAGEEEGADAGAAVVGAELVATTSSAAYKFWFRILFMVNMWTRSVLKTARI